MQSFTINDLERLSGIKAATIRIWERRYQLFEPSRSSGNVRIYSFADLEKLLPIALLTKNGYRISTVLKSTAYSLDNAIQRIAEDDVQWEHAINQLIVHMYHSKQAFFDELLDELLVTWKITILVEKIIAPFLFTTGLLWKGHQRDEEHLVVTAIRKKLILAIETLPNTSLPSFTTVLFLPDKKQLDLGLLYANYLLKKSSVKLIYLGNDINLQNLKYVIDMKRPNYLFTYLFPKHPFKIPELLKIIKENSPASVLLVSTYSHGMKDKSASKNFRQLPFQEALDFLQHELVA
ncbi:MAG: MerR family transcriptional regulator [Ferruginibacter sp.]